MNIGKYLLLLIFGVLTFEIVGALLIAPEKLNDRILKDSHLHIHFYQFDTLGIKLYNCLPTKMDSLLVREYGEKYGINTVLVNEAEYEEYRSSRNKYAMAYQVSKDFIFNPRVKLFSGTNGYGESWEMEYLWVFYKWIRIQRECIGQS